MVIYLYGAWWEEEICPPYTALEVACYSGFICISYIQMLLNNWQTSP